MSDLMDTSKTEKSNLKSREVGTVEHNEWTSDHNRYVTVKTSDGKVITGSNADKSNDDLMDW